MIVKINLPWTQVVKYNAARDIIIVDWAILNRLQQEKVSTTGEKWKFFAEFADNPDKQTEAFKIANERLGRVGIDLEVQELITNPLFGIYI